MGGMFIKTTRPLDVSLLRLRSQITGRSTPVETYAEVKWVVREEHLNAGMGVAFESLSESDERAVRRWLDDWEQTNHEDE